MDTRFVKGTVVGAVGATVLVLTGAAFAGTGVGAVFNLGRTNTVNAQSTLKGATSHHNLQITNTGSGHGLGITVGAGKAPITVNQSAGKATNLNADKLDGHDSSYFGVRAYGLIAGTNVERSKNIVSASNPSPGVFCLTLAPSIDAMTAVPVVTPDFMLDDTNTGANAAQSFAEFGGEPEGNCADDSVLDIITGVRTVTTSGSTDGDVRAVTNTLANEGFTVVIP
jgi:hypothetical protein